MKNNHLVACALSSVLLVSAPVLYACGGNQAGADGSAETTQEADVAQEELAPEEAIAQAELKWNGKTMGIDYVTDEEGADMAGVDFEGKGVRIVFFCKGNESFDGSTLFDDLKAKAITLKDSEGNVYEWDGAISDIQVDLVDGGFSIAKSLPRFGVAYDVPTDVKLEDLTLVVGDDELALTEYTSDAYAADTSDSSDSE